MDRETRLAYQRAYRKRVYRERRDAFFADKACVDCGATEDLHLDHRDPTDKIDHRFWTWTESRRLAELAKCDVRCGCCHRKRHGRERQRHGIKRYWAGCRCGTCRLALAAYYARRAERARLGIVATTAKLDAEQVRDLRAKVAAGMLQRDAAMFYGIREETVNKIVTRKTWRNVV